MIALNTDEIGDSEKKRLESLKQKKEAFRAKELAVQNALRNLDSKSSKNKIIFDDDIDKIEQPKSTEKERKKKRKRDLFDNEDNNENDDNDTDWNAKFEFNKNVTGKFKPNITLGNDERFKLDDRFMEEDQKSDENDDENATESIDETSNLQKEKELQLDILENILGVPIVSKNKDANKDEKIPKKGMIRYDPTESNHKEYEINTDKLEEETKKVKKKKKAKDSVEDANENPPVEVSKEVFFSVSDSLSKSLKEEGQFSLLKAYGKATEVDKEEDKQNTEALKPAKFQFDFNSKNPFKYDSSDDERDDKKEVLINEEPTTNDVIEDTGKLFFDINDVRFNEAIKFFSKERAPEDAFKELRRELKQIVRSKIRRNVKKKQPWGYKKKVKRS